jgi:hypothetical protein
VISLPHTIDVEFWSSHTSVGLRLRSGMACTCQNCVSHSYCCKVCPFAVIHKRYASDCLKCFFSLTPPPTPTVPDMPAMAWAPPSQARSGTSNERRVQSYTSHRAAGIPGTASPFTPFPTGVRPVNSGSTRTSSRPVRVSNRADTSRRSSEAESLSFQVVLLPYPVRTLYT